MKEIIGNAWRGWLDYTEAGKFAALLFAALLFFWFVKKEEWKKYHTLFKYTTVMAVCCICPLTAAVLMIYQTKFYDYQWIWNAIPITTVISLAGTLLWTEWKERCDNTKGGNWKKVSILMAMICILYFCGRMGQDVWDADREMVKKQDAESVLEIITENGQNTNIVLWAPQGIMEYARALRGDIRLPYGRNMWDPALNAYSYEVYGEAENTLYQWMVEVEANGDGELSCMEEVSELGINHMILPKNTTPDLLKGLERYWGVTAEKIGEYYWICIG